MRMARTRIGAAGGPGEDRAVQLRDIRMSACPEIDQRSIGLAPFSPTESAPTFPVHINSVAARLRAPARFSAFSCEALPHTERDGRPVRGAGMAHARTP